MRKEAKIGLAVILALLITLGVVLARRLTGPTDGPAATASSDRENTAAEKADPAAKGTKSKAQAAKKPTVVAMKTVTNKSPKHSGAQWSVVSNRNDTEQTARAAKAPLPSYMPKPTLPTASTYQGGYGAAAQQSTVAKPWQQSGTGTAAPLGVAQVPDPFQNRQAQMPPVDGPVNQNAGGLTLLDGPTQSPVQSPIRSAQTSRYGYNRSSPAQYPSTDSTAQQMPSYQQNSPYTYGGRSRYGAGSSVSQYGAKSLRAQDGTYEVHPNDNYWIISNKLYGSGAYFKALAEHNRGKLPQEDKLAVGDVISAPEVSELEELYPGLCPKPSRRDLVKHRASTVSTHSIYGGGRTYTVEEGDTLFDIARYELGKASRWVEIYQLNRDVLGDDHDYLTPGLKLALPNNARADSITRRPDASSGSYYQR